MSTNLAQTAYVKMIDCWLIFSLLKPFLDIIVQTYLQTLREENLRVAPGSKVKAWSSKTQSNWKIDFCQKFVVVVYPVFFLVFILVFWLVGLAYYYN